MSVKTRKTVPKRRNTINVVEMEDSGARYTTTDEEDMLIIEVLPKMDIIEKKSTDRSLNAQRVTALQTKTWEEILVSFNEKTKVCFMFSRKKMRIQYGVCLLFILSKFHL